MSHCGLPPTFTQPLNGELRCVKTSGRRKLCCYVHFTPYVIMEIYLSDSEYSSDFPNISIWEYRGPACLQASLMRNNSGSFTRSATTGLPAPRPGYCHTRALPLEHAVARVCREAGAKVARNLRLADMNLEVPVADAPRIEVVANGLPFDATTSCRPSRGSAPPPRRCRLRPSRCRPAQTASDVPRAQSSPEPDAAALSLLA